MPKKKKKWPIVVAVCVGVVALAIWGVSSLMSNLRQRIPTNIQTATAQSGVIESTVVGSGSLGYADSDTVSIPLGVEVTDVLLKAGENVEAGEFLATVDAKSCEVLMSETYDEIAALEEKMRETSSEPEVLQITAPISGEVETVSVHDGSSVLDSLASSGSLITISPGGKMGAEIQCADPPQAGQRVTFVFADGSEKSALVESVTEDAFVASVTNAAQEAGAPVEAKDAAGNVLGSGSLKALDSMSVVAPAGTVEGLKAAPGEKVEAGEALFSVRCADPPAAYQELEKQRDDLTERYDTLSSLLQNGGLVSPVSGAVVSCLLEEGETGTSPSASSPYQAIADSGLSPQDAMNAFGMGMSRHLYGEPVTESLGLTQGGENILLSAPAPDETDETAPEPPETETPAPSSEAPEPTPAPPDSSSTAVPPTASATDAPPTQAPSAEPTREISLGIPRITVPLIPPIPSLPLQNRIDMLPLYQGEVTWTPEGENAEFSTVYTARISLKALDPFYFEPDCAVTLLGADAADVSVTATDGSSVLTFSATYEKTMNKLAFPEIDWNAIRGLLGGASMDLNSLASILSSGLLPSGALNFDPSALYASAGFDPSSMYDASLFGNALPDGAGAYDAYSSAQNPYETAAYTIASADKMELTIEINQMDILFVHPDMECRVTVDALEGKEYHGVVSEVAAVGNTSGAYEATIDVDAADGMLSGMTASAVITTSQTQSAVTIPAAAVQEDGSRTFVYTSYEDETFGGEKDVTTGVSNGSDVEITAGLSDGETVYYPGENIMSQMMRMMQGSEPGDGPEISAVETSEP